MYLSLIKYLLLGALRVDFLLRDGCFVGIAGWFSVLWGVWSDVLFFLQIERD